MEKEQLQQALKVFDVWLAEEAQAANLNVAAIFNASSTTKAEVAELVGVARGLSAAADLLRARIAVLP